MSRARRPADDILRLPGSACDKRERWTPDCLEVVEGPAAAGAVPVEAAVALDEQAIGRAGYLIQVEEVEANPPMGARRVAVRLALAVSAGRSTDQQRKCEQGDGQRQSGESRECLRLVRFPPYGFVGTI
jgi:hypothetical protein